jgi:transcriptional regulator with XRE-family HTH domain
LDEEAAMTAATEDPLNGGYAITERDRIRVCRDRRGWTQGDLVRESGMSRATISAIENGGKVSRRSRVSLALVFGVKPNWLESGALDFGDGDGIPAGPDVRTGYRIRRIHRDRITPDWGTRAPSAA